MEKLKVGNLYKSVHLDKTALVYYSETDTIEEISYKALLDMAIAVRTFMVKNIIDSDSYCIGLLMERNTLIPPIIISFQDLNYAFSFMSLSNLQDRMKMLNVRWILSISDISDLQTLELVDVLTLRTDQKLFLWRNNNVDIKSTDYRDVFSILQTSGSTGECKIVQVPHSCIESNVKALGEHFQLTNTEEIIYWGTPLTFDPSLVELLLAIFCQATLLIVSGTVALNPVQLYKALFRSVRVTFLQTVPSLFFRWSGQFISDILLKSSLKTLAFGGEPFPANLLGCPRKSDLKLFNLYGVTELSCWATVADLDLEKPLEEVSLGRPLNDTFIELRSEDGRLIKHGIGEIYVGSESRYCWVNAEKTSLVKTGDLGEWHRNGQLLFRGRKTRIVKRLGCNIIMYKIEEAIFNETGLKSRLVYSKESGKLLLFVLIDRHYDGLDKVRLLDKMKVKILKIVPEHACPDFLDVVTHFPLSNHGKICDKSLENLYKASLETQQFREATDIFVDLLTSFVKAPLRDNMHLLGRRTFFELGANSIQAVQLLNSFSDIVGCEIPSALVTHLINDSLLVCIDYVKAHVKFKRRRSDSGALASRKMQKTSSVSRDDQPTVLWKYDLKGCVDSSPLAFKRNGRIFIAASSFAQIFAVVNDDGTEYLKLTLPQEIESQPCLSVCNDYIFIGCTNGTFYCIDLDAKSILWEFAASDSIKSAACLCGTSVVFGSYDGWLYCLTNKEGTLVWKTRLEGGIKASPISNESSKRIYVGTIKAMCYALNADDGSVLWTHKADGPIFGSPCMMGNLVAYPSVTGQIHCIDFNGQLQRVVKINGMIFSALVEYEGAIYLGCHDSFVYKVNNAGETFRIAQLDSEISSSPRLYRLEETLFIACACNSGFIYVIDATVGKIIFKKRLPGEVFASPHVLDGRLLYVGCRDDNLYCINIERDLKM